MDVGADHGAGRPGRRGRIVVHAAADEQLLIGRIARYASPPLLRDC